MFITTGSRSGRNRRSWGVAPHLDQNGARTAYDLELVSPFPVGNQWNNSNYYQNRLSFSAGGGGTDYGSILFGGQFNLRGYIAAYQGSIGIGLVSATQAGYLSSAKALIAPAFLFNGSSGNMNINFGGGGSYTINNDTRLFRNNAVGYFAVGSNSDSTGATLTVYGLGGQSAAGGTYTNYSRLTFSASNAGGATIATEALGTGTGGPLTITASGLAGASPKSWVFDTAGNLTVPSSGTQVQCGTGGYLQLLGSNFGPVGGFNGTNHWVSDGSGNFLVKGMVAPNQGGVPATIDAAIGRNAAGVLEINNGTAGTWRDLKLRNLIFADGSTQSIAATGSADPYTQTTFYGGL